MDKMIEEIAEKLKAYRTKKCPENSCEAMCADFKTDCDLCWAKVLRQIFIKHLREVVEGAELTDEEIKEKLGEIQPEGFDWVNITEAEIYKFRAIANAATAKVKGLMEAEIRALQRERIGEVWYWQDDAEDHLESLTCPILIEAQALRDMLAKVKGLMEAEHKAEIERLREEILEQQKYIHGGE